MSRGRKSARNYGTHSEKMPKPHLVMQAEIKSRLRGKTGGARIDEIRKIIEELPKYKDGPYAKIRKNLFKEIDNTQVRRSIVSKDMSFAIRKEGYRQIMMVGPPNAGKSTLFNALTRAYSKVGEYAFTTLTPIPGTFVWKDAKFQLVDMPGIIEKASEGKGLGTRLLALVRNAEILLIVIDLSANPIEQYKTLVGELQKGHVSIPKIIVVGNKSDITDPTAIENFRGCAGKMPFVALSALNMTDLDNLKELIYQSSNLMRVFLRVPGKDHSEPMHIKPGSRIKDVVQKIHKDLLKRFKFAKIWGSSAKFDGQQVGLEHVVSENDTIEVYSLH